MAGLARNDWKWLEMAFGTVKYFLVIFGTSGHSKDSKLGLLGASLGRPFGVFWASLRRVRLGHPSLGLDLAKLGCWNGWTWLDMARNGVNGWKLLEMTEISGNG